jgi:hypothetical protein
MMNNLGRKNFGWSHPERSEGSALITTIRLAITTDAWLRSA